MYTNDPSANAKVTGQGQISSKAINQFAISRMLIHPQTPSHLLSNFVVTNLGVAFLILFIFLEQVEIPKLPRITGPKHVSSLSKTYTWYCVVDGAAVIEPKVRWRIDRPNIVSEETFRKKIQKYKDWQNHNMYVKMFIFN